VSRLLLGQGGAAWQGVPVGAGDAPQPGDVVHGEVDVIVHDDVTADSTVLIRVTDGQGILAERTDLTSIERGSVTTVQTAPVADEARMRAGADTLWVELHNDTEGTIEFTDVRLWGERGGERIDYTLPDADFSAGLTDETWGSAGAEVVRDAELAPGASIERTVAVEEEGELPRPGDRIGLAADVFAPGATPSPARITVSVGATVLTELSATDAAATWQRREAPALDAVPDGADELTVRIENGSDRVLRVRGLALSGERRRWTTTMTAR
jgi:hypothetical protein